MLLGTSLEKRELKRNLKSIKLKKLQFSKKVFAWVPTYINYDGRYAWLQFVWKFSILEFKEGTSLAIGIFCKHVSLSEKDCLEQFKKANFWIKRKT